MLTENQIEKTEPTPEERRAQIKEAIKGVIAEYGFAVQGVFDPTYMKPSFLYTVGLSTKLNAEVIIVAEAEIMTLHPLFNEVISEVIKRDDKNFEQEYSAGFLLDGKTPLRVKFQEVTERPEIDDLVTMREGEVNRVFQLLLSDDKNILPGEEGYCEDWIYDLSSLNDEETV